MAELLHHRARALILVDKVAVTLDRVADDLLMSEQALRQHLRHSAMILRRIIEADSGSREGRAKRTDRLGTSRQIRGPIRIRLFSDQPAPAEDDGQSAA